MENHKKQKKKRVIVSILSLIMIAALAAPGMIPKNVRASESTTEMSASEEQSEDGPVTPGGVLKQDKKQDPETDSGLTDSEKDSTQSNEEPEISEETTESTEDTVTSERDSAEEENVSEEEESERDPDAVAPPEAADNNSGENEGVRLADTDPLVDVSKKDMKNECTDALTETYIKKNVNKDYVTFQEINIAHAIFVKQTMFDGDLMEDGDTPESILDGIENGEDEQIPKLLTQVSAPVAVYDVNPESEYYVIFANTLQGTPNTEVVDCVFAKYNDYAELIDGCYYDAETGLAYIPKDLFGDEVLDLQIQLMQVLTDNYAEAETTTDTISTNGAKKNTTVSSLINTETITQVEKGMDTDSLTVSVNGMPIPEDYYVYDGATGEIRIDIPSAMAQTVSATDDSSQIKRAAKKMFGVQAASALTASDMYFYKSNTVTIPDWVRAGDYFTGTAWLRYKTSGQIHYDSLDNYHYGYKGNDSGLQSLINAIESGSLSYGNIKLRTHQTGMFTYHMDLTNNKLYRRDGSSGSFMSGWGQFTLECAHATSSLGKDSVATMPDWGWSKAAVRIFEINRTSGYALIGIISAKSHNQIGANLFKMRISKEVPEDWGKTYTIKQGHTPETINITVNKTDSKSGSKIDKATFDVYEDGKKIGTIQTTNGVATYKRTRNYWAYKDSGWVWYLKNWSSLTSAQKKKWSMYYDSYASAKKAADALAKKGYDAKIKTQMEAKHTWKIVETSAPFGHTVASSSSQTQTEGASTKSLTFNFSNAPQTAELTVKKTNSLTGNATTLSPEASLNGATYGLFAKTTIYKNDNKTVAYSANAKVAELQLKLVNGEYVATKTGLYPGNYYVKELSAPKGFALSTAQVDVALTDNTAKTVTIKKTVNVSDDEIRGNFKISKTYGPDETPEEGAKFEIYNSNNEKVYTITTNAQGIATVNNVPYGHYTVKQISGHPGTVMAANGDLDFFIETNGQSVNKTVNDELTELTIQKSTLDSPNGKPRGAESTLEGAVYDIKAAQPIKTSSGDQVYASNALVRRVSLDENGKAIVTGLLPGSYYVVESTPPAGHMLNSQRYNVTLTNRAPGHIKLVNVGDNEINGDYQITKTYGPDETPEAGAKFEIYNSNNEKVYTITTNAQGIAKQSNIPFGDYTVKQVSGKDGYGFVGDDSFSITKANNNKLISRKFNNEELTIKIKKINTATNNSTTKGSNSTLLGAEYGVYARTTITKYDGSKINPNTLVDTIILDKDGNGESNPLPKGEYYVKETKAPIGFKLNTTDSYNFTLTDAKAGNPETIRVYDDEFMANLRIVKTYGDDERPEKGAQFKIYEGSEEKWTLTTNANGIATLNNIPYGTYTIKQTKGIGGYVFASNTNFKVDGTTNGTTIEKVFQNDIRKINIKKVNGNTINGRTEGSEATYEGAVYGVYAKTDILNNDGAIYKTADTLVKKVTLDENGEGTAEPLYAGKYYVKEITAPPGYELSTAVYNVTVGNSASNKTVNVTAKDNEILGDLKIIKTYGDNKLAEAGAVFEVYNSNNQKVYTLTTNADGIAQQNDIPYGTYNVKQVAGKAGYARVDDFSIKIDGKQNAKTIEKNLNNKPTEVTIYKFNLTTGKANTKGVEANLAGAVYGIYAAAVIKDDNNTTLYNKDALVRQVTIEKTGSDYTATAKELPAGSYYVKEITAPEGFRLSAERYPFTLGNTLASRTVTVKAYDEEMSASFQLLKTYGNDHLPESGARFQVWNADNKVAYEVTTDTNGRVTIPNIPYGTYIVKQTKGIEGYEMIDDFELVVDGTTDGTTIQITRNDEIIEKKGDITIVKRNGNTVDGQIEGKDAQFAGAKYGIYAAENITKRDGTVVHQKDKLVKVLYLNGYGRATATNLLQGKYYVKEIEAPEGFVLNTEKTNINLVSPQGLQEVSETANVSDNEIRGNLKITKTYGDNSLPEEGATFDVIDSEGEVFATITTNAEGIAVKNNVPYGKYTIVQTSGKEGCALIEPEQITVGENSNGQTIEKEFNNESVKLKIKKLNSLTGESDTKGVEATLAGAVYTLYANETIYKADNTTVAYRKNDVVETMTITQSGEGFTAEAKDLLPGKYYVKETTAPTGFLLDNTVYDVELKGNNAEAEKELTVYDKEVSGNFAIHKTCGKDRVAEYGATFDIYNSDGIKVYTISTDSNGYAEQRDIPYGTYTVKQTKGTDGNAFVNDFTFTIDETKEGKTVTQELYNEPIEVQISKINEVTRNKNTAGIEATLEGAVYGIYANGSIVSANDPDIAYAKDDLVEEAVLDEDGNATVSGLLPGSYYLKEITPPTGFVKSNDSYPFTVENHIGENTASVEVSDREMSAKLKVIKTYGNNHVPEENASFDIYNSNDTKVGTIVTGADGIAISEDLPYGKYTVKQATGKNGYELVDDFIVIVDESTDETTIEKTYNDAPLTVTIQKYNKLTNSVAIEGKEATLQGAVYGVYANAAIQGTDGSTSYAKDQKVQEVTLGVGGRAETGPLTPGKYYLKEITPPEGFALSNEKVDFEVKNTDKNSQVIKVQDEEYNGHFWLWKYYSDGQTNQPEAGAEFTIYDCTGEAVYVITADETGLAEQRDIPYGTYTVKQTKGIEGYYTIDDFQFTIDSSSHKGYVTKRFTDERIPVDTKIQITKYKVIDDSKSDTYYKEPEENAEFEIYDADNNLAGTITTDENGYGESELLEPGIYTLKQTVSAKGYAPIDPMEVDISKNYIGYVDYELENEFNGNKIVIDKKKKGLYTTSVENDAEFIVVDIEKAKALDTSQEDFGSYPYDLGDDAKRFGCLNYLLEHDCIIQALTTDNLGHAEAIVYPDKLGDEGFALIQSKGANGYEMQPLLEAEDASDTVDGVFDTYYYNLVDEYKDFAFVRVSKTMQTGIEEYKPEKNAVFQILDADTKEVVQTLTTDANGFAKSKELLFGHYLLHQVSGANNHILSEDVEFTLNASNRKQTVQFNLQNEAEPVELRLTKTDAEDSTHLLDEAVYEIVDADTNEVVDTIITGGTEADEEDQEGTNEEVEENEAEHGVAKSTLPYGNYFIREVVSPNGYKKSEETIPVKITASTARKDSDGNYYVPVTTEDELIYGHIKITKKGEVLTGTTKTDTGTRFDFTEDVIPDATYGLFAREDIVSPDGLVTYYHAGDKIGEGTTDAEGNIEFTREFDGKQIRDLYMGKYYVKELVSPDGYLLDETEHDITLSADAGPGKYNRRDDDDDQTGTTYPDRGEAYAVLASNGKLIFFRSEEAYSNNTSGTFTDIKGETYTGTIYSGIEGATGPHGWSETTALAQSVTSVETAEGSVIRPKSMGQWFNGCSNMTSCDLFGFDTSNTTKMNSVFNNCSSLTGVALDNVDTGKVTTMANMFAGCSSLTDIDLRTFNTSKVTNMAKMFYNCSSLQTLDIHTFDTSAVNNMQQMFAGCSGLTALDLSDFSTDSATNTKNMFDGCNQIKSLDLGEFDTSKVTAMDAMFKGCSNIEKIYVSDKWDTAAVTSSANMFQGCTKLPNFNSSTVDVSKANYNTGGYLTLKGSTADASLTRKNNDPNRNVVQKVLGIENVYAAELDNSDKKAGVKEDSSNKKASVYSLIYHDKDFSSSRLLVKADDREEILDDNGEVLGELNGYYLVQYDSQKDAMAAYTKYRFKKADAYVDATLKVADGNVIQKASDKIMSAEDNPFSKAEDIAESSTDKAEIALIDTGVTDESVKEYVVSGKSSDSNTHGDEMLSCIKSEDADAKVISIKALDENGRGSVSDVYAAIKLAMDKDVKCINLSLYADATKDNECIAELIEEATDKGIIVVGAAGNDNLDARNHIPGNVGAAIIAGSVEKDGKLATFSSYGPSVDYYIESSSTSEAAARISGILSANQFDKECLEEQVQKGRLFTDIVAPGEIGVQSDKDSNFKTAAWTINIQIMVDGASMEYNHTDSEGQSRKLNMPSEKLADSSGNIYFRLATYNGQKWIQRWASNSWTYNADYMDSAHNSVYNAYNVDTYGLSKTGYYIDGTKAYLSYGNANLTGSYTTINQDSCTLANLNGGTAPSSGTYTRYLKVNWQPYVLTTTYYANGGTRAESTGNTPLGDLSSAMTNNTTALGTATIPYNGHTLTFSNSTPGNPGKQINISEYGLPNGNPTGSMWDLSRTGYTATKYWHLGSPTGTLVDGDIAYTTAQALATALGVNLGTANRSVKLYMHWTPNTYTISYAGMDGATHGTNHPTSATYDTAFTVNNPTKPGYTFTGWKITGMDSVTHTYGSSTTTATSINSTTETSFKNLRSTSGTVTFTAQWTPNTYTIAYAGMDGATHGTNHPTSATYDTAFTVNNPTKTGYTFTGWKITGMDSVTHTYGTSTTTATSINSTTETSFKNLRSTSGTVTFTAQWTPNTYTIAYAGMDGATHGTNHPTSATYDTAFTVNNPTKTGYTFTGWKITGMDGVTHTYGSSTTTATSINSTKETSFKNLRSTSGTVTFTAQWTPNTYTIAYAGMDGATHGTNHPTSATYNTAFTVNNPSKTGYTFTGWKITGMDSVTHTYGTSTTTATSINSTTETSFKNLRSTSGTVTFTAQWTPITYSIKYNANGATGTMSNSSHTYDVAKALTNNSFTKTGYHFDKWTTNADGTGTAYTNGQSVTNLSSTSGATVNLYAQWAPNTYTVAYNANGGTGTTANSSHTYDVAKTLTANGFTRSGYTFKGWSTSSTATTATYTNKQSVTNLTTTNNATVTLYAVWEPNLTVRYNANGGTINTGTGETRYRLTSNVVERSTDSGATWSVFTNTYLPSTQYVNLTNVATFGITKTGYHVVGTEAWNTKADGTGNKLNQDYSATSTTNPATATTINGGAAVTAPKTVTIYANWIPNTYTVTYNANGGTGTTANSSHTYDTAKALTANGFTRSGYKFLGWSTSSTATTATYTDKQSVTNLTATNNGTVTLYAVWTPILTVQYNPNGGTITTGTDATQYRVSGNLVQVSSDSGATWQTATTSVPGNTAYPNLYNIGTFKITKTGYHAIAAEAWNTKADLTGIKLNSDYSASNTTNPSTVTNLNGGAALTGPKTVTIYAAWHPNTYTVTYNANGGTGTTANSSHTYDVNKALTTNGFTKTGYHFDGWNTKANGTGTSYTDGQSVKNLTATNNGTVTLYAKWAPNTYTIAYAGMSGATYGTNHPTSATYDTAFTVNNPTKPGHTFTGWKITGMDGVTHTYGTATTTATSINSTTETSFKNLRSTSGTVTFTAQWSANPYTVTYHSNFGTETTTTQNVNYGSTWTTKANNTFTRTGYALSSWNTAADGSGTSYNVNTAQSAWASTSGLDLYAQWIPYTLTIKYYGNGAVTDIKSGSPVAVTNQLLATRNVRYDGTDLATTGLANANGGTWNLQKPGYHANAYWIVGSATNTLKLNADTKYATVQEMATAAGVDLSTGSKTINLYADYSPNTYTVTYGANGGTGTTANSTHTYDTAKALTANGFSKTGYHFKNWNTELNGSGTSYTNSQSVMNLATDNNATVTLYAQWEANTYTVKYNANGGTGTMANSSHTYGTAKALTTNGFSKTGYKFKEWNTKADGTGTSYTNGQSVTNLTATNQETVNLYAQWEPINYKVAFNANTGAGFMPPITVAYDSDRALPANAFAKPDYVFAGWNTQPDGSGTPYSNKGIIRNLSSTENETVTLYAQWRPDDMGEIEDTLFEIYAIPKYETVYPQEPITASLFKFIATFRHGSQRINITDEDVSFSVETAPDSGTFNVTITFLGELAEMGSITVPLTVADAPDREYEELSEVNIAETYTDDLQKMSYMIKKEDANGNALEGAEFQVKALVDIYDSYDNLIMKQGTILGTMVSDASGNAVLQTEYPTRLFTKTSGDMFEITETKAPDGYAKSNDVIRVQGIPEAGKVVTSVSNTMTNDKLDTVSIKKIWDDDLSGLTRPASINITIKKNGQTVKTVTLTEADNWYLETDLPIKENGNDIQYTFEEAAVAGYQVSYSYNDGVETITNTATNIPDNVNLTVKKEWVDQNNADQIRPESVTVDLIQGATDETSEYNYDVYGTYELNQQNNWTVTVNNLPTKDESGKKWSYTFVEEYTDVVNGDEMKGYSSTSSTTGLITTITNTHTPTTKTAKLNKSWNKDGATIVLPETVTMRLLANGEPYVAQGFTNPITFTGTNQDKWSYEIPNLPAFKNGEPVEYSFEEVFANGETGIVVEDANNKGEWDNDKTASAKGRSDLTNTFKSYRSLNIQVTKNWEDNLYEEEAENRERPVFILKGYDGSTLVETRSSEDEDTWDTESDSSSWTYTFNNIDLDLTYYVEEEPYPGYTTTVNGVATNTAEVTDLQAEFTNTKTETRDLSVTKYVDGNMGNRFIDFNFRVSITGLERNATYETSSGNTITTDNTGSVTARFELADSETWTVYGLPLGAQYTVTEETPINYNATWSYEYVNVEGNTQRVENNTTRTISADQYNPSITCVNELSTTVPTGVITNIMIIFIMLIIGAGALFLSFRPFI